MASPPADVAMAEPAVLEVANPQDQDDLDSTLGSDDTSSETTSLASTILRHRELHGRTYHKFHGGQNDYWGPNDERQNEQLDLGHHMLTRLLDGKLYDAPISKDTLHAIDLGCGTGIWTLDFADAHPGADVVGVDLSPIQPTWVPPNCTFVIDDCTDPWTFPESHFDFVHIRCLYGSVSDWPSLYDQIYRHTKPGGYIEQMEISIEFKSDDGTVTDDHVMSEWSRVFIEAGEKMGKTMKIANNAAELIRKAGFTDIHEQWYKLPIGKWPKDRKLKELGVFNYHYCSAGFEGWAMYLLTKVMGWSPAEVYVLVSRMNAALKDKAIHCYYQVVNVYGKKPETG